MGAQITPVLSAVTDNFVTLIQDQYGNYIVQQSMSYASACMDHKPGSEQDLATEEGEPEVLVRNKHLKQKALAQLTGHVRRLSQTKYGSNVIEFVIKIHKNSYWSAVMTEELFAEPAEEVRMFINDRFGNYVLQTALMLSCPKQLALVINAVSANMPYFRPVVKQKWNKLLTEAKQRMMALGQAFMPLSTVAATKRK